MTNSTRIILALLVSTLAIGCGSDNPVDPGASDDDQPDPSTPTLEVTEDIPFAEAQQVGLVDRALDVYALSETDGQPVAVLLHGGSGGRKGLQYVGVAERLAQAGVVVFVPSYTPGGPTDVFGGDGSGLRERLETVECAIRHARARAADYGGDPDEITVIGQSAGGLFGGLIAFLDGDLSGLWTDLNRISIAPAKQMRCLEEDADASVQGFAGFNAAHFIGAAVGISQEFQDLVSIETYAGMNPSLVVRFILGSADRQTPSWHVERVAAFATALSDAGYDADTVMVKAAHDFDPGGASWGRTLATLLEVIQPES